MKEKISVIQFSLISMLISLLMISACKPMRAPLKDPQGIQTVFNAGEIPGETELTFSEIDWARQDKLTIQGWRIGYHPGYIGDITSGNILPLQMNDSILTGSIPLLSNDGHYVAFQSKGKFYIVSMDKIAPNNYSITSDSYVNILDREYRCNHSWSSDSSQLAFVCLVPNGITVSHYDLIEKEVKDIFEYSEEYVGDIEGSSWSSNGTLLAFSLRYEYHDDQLSQTDIFIYDFGKESLTRISNTPRISERNPEWYPKSSVLTFALTVEGEAESVDSSLVFSTEDGKCMKTLPDLKGFVYPSWSPDGSQLAYISDWTEIKVLDTSQFVPLNFLSPQGLCDSQ